MKLLGADGLTIGDGAVNKIQSTYVVDGDVCCAKYNDKFYWYILEGGNSTPENLPQIIKPEVGTESKRWVLKGIYMDELELDTLFVSTITEATTAGIDLNGIATLSGNTFTFNSITEAPFVVNSQVMIDNLNAEYLGGKHWSEYDLENIIKSGSQWISQGVSSIYVPFPEPRFNTTYSLFTELQNVTSPTSLMNYMVTDKTNLGFTVILSSNTNNPYYILQWAILGENIDAEEYNLQDVLGNNITDKDDIQITVY